jgi:formylglycine-generating enzyme required for sulfatase activity
MLLSPTSITAKPFARRLAIAVIVACAATRQSNAVTIDMVTVGNPGNAPDTRYNSAAIGSVGYVYQIGKYEVTAGQYTEFLNAVAKADPNALYNTNMANLANKGANILRTGDSPNFSYSVDPDWANRPVNIVSFWDAVRFANWLHNGQPTGPQGPGTTEDGAYHNVGNDILFGRNPGARFFIPNANEWYKAAYHDSTAGLAASYFDFPTRSNATPGKDPTEATNPGNNVNHDQNSSSGPFGAPYYRTAVGEFELSASPYGTFDQAGNVKEWNETEVPFPFGSARELRGGSFYDGFFLFSASLKASNRSYDFPTNHFDNVGFRVAGVAVPEASTFISACLAVGVCLASRRRRCRSTNNGLQRTH